MVSLRTSDAAIFILFCSCRRSWTLVQLDFYPPAPQKRTLAVCVRRSAMRLSAALPVSQILSLYSTPVIYLTLDRLRRRAAAVMYVPSKLKSSASPPYCGNTKFVLQFRLDGFYEGRIHFLSLWKCIGPAS
jgi:hypothetical protein